MQANTTIKLKRLQKQQNQLQKDPLSNVLVKRQGILDFHFVIYNLDGDFKNGFYYGLLQLHENYPFAAPKLFFYTPSGRFQLNMPICTSFTNYHQESWTSAWNVRSLLLGTVSFMTSDEASYGCRNDSSQTRKMYARSSLAYNLKIPKFRQLFLDQLKQLDPPVLNTQSSVNPSISEENNEENLGQLQLNGQNIQENLQIVHDDQLLIENQRRQRQQRQRQNKCKKIIIAGAVILFAASIGWFVFSRLK